MGAILSSLIALAAELAPPSKRGLFVTVVSGFWSFGMMYVAFIAYITMGLWGLSWRPFVALSGLPAALSVLLVWCFVPESARFLALHGKYDEATRSANDIAARIGYRGKKIEMVELYYQYYHQNHCMDSSAQGATLRESIREASKNIAALYSAELRNSTISLQLLWIFLEMGSGLASFVNVIFKEERANEYLGTFVGAIGDLIGKVVGAILLDKASRKWIALWSLVSASVTLLCFAWTVHRKKQEFARLALSVVVFAMLLSIGWSANLVMTSEMFPTKVRSTALGFVASSGRLANVVQQFINGALIDRPAILLSVASGILMLGALTTRIIKTEDMTGQDLTDTISHDGERRDFVLVPFSSCHKDGDVKQEGEVSLPPPVV